MKYDRRKARELAFQTLFQNEFENRPHSDNTIPAPHKNSHDVNAYSRFLIEGVLNKQGEIDKLIEENSLNWRVQRIAFVDKTILRIAIYEMLFSNEKLTPRVAINEAVELAKKFGSDDTRSFINGILDQVAKKQNSHEPS